MRVHAVAPRHFATIDTFPLLLFVLALLVAALALTPSQTMHGPYLPHATTAAPLRADHPVFGIDWGGRFYDVASPVVGPIPAAELPDRLRRAYASRPGDRVLYLIADRSVEYSAVLSVVGAARQAGVREIGFIAECPRGRESLRARCLAGEPRPATAHVQP